jgi:proteic killer suppression protein
MLFRHADKTLKRIDEEPDFNGGLAENLVRAFRMRMQLIRAAANENDLRAVKSLHFEKLKGDRKHQYSIRLNNQFRLILEFEPSDRGKVAVVVGLDDYH